MKSNTISSLLIEKTKGSPKISLDLTTNEFLIEGRSFPDDAQELYKPICEWLSTYAKNPLKTTNFKFKLVYFNSISQKYFYEILMILKKINKGNSTLSIEWFFQAGDDDMYEIGKEFETLTELKFNFIDY